MLISHAQVAVPNAAPGSLLTPFWRTKFRCGQSRPYQIKAFNSIIFLANWDVFWTLERVFSLLSGRGCSRGPRSDLSLFRESCVANAFLDPLFFKNPEPVDAVEGRDLVAFRQGRVVEHRVDEVVDRAAERQHRLTDVDQLAGTLADDVDAEQLAGLAVKDQLEEPGDVAEDLAAGDLLVARLADLVGSGGLW